MSLDYNSVNNIFKSVFARSATAEEASQYAIYSADSLKSALYATTTYQEQTLPIARLYTALLGRDPEPGGLNFYIHNLRDGKMTLASAANGFLHSPEAQFKFGYLNASDVDFIQTLYQTVLGRAGEAAGVEYYLNKLATGTSDRANVAVSFSYSPENIAKVGAKQYSAFDAAAATKHGIAADGYIARADVFADANGDGIWNEGEAKTTTDDFGNWSLTDAKGVVVVSGGQDISTNLRNTQVLKAPAGATVVNPLTTLQAELSAQ